MKRFVLVLMVLLTGFVSPAVAVTYNMYESFTNRDGVSTWDANADPFSATTYNFTPDLTWSTSFSTPGAHYFGLYIDVEIDEVENTFFNEYGEANGTPAAGQSWEIDLPDVSSPNPSDYWGDIYWNAQDAPLFGQLDNLIFYDAIDGWTNPDLLDDVAMALAWDFSLSTGETAFLNFRLSDVAPSTGFYLAQHDPDSQASLFFSSTLSIRPPTVIPEPSTFVLFGSVVVGLGFYLRRRHRA